MPPLIRIQSDDADDAAPPFAFHYRRDYTNTLRPLGCGVAFEGELTFEVRRMRVVWLQQFIAGAFDYNDHQILAGFVRGMADLSKPFTVVPPNRFRPMRLRLALDEPTLLLPRNVHALASERRLREHSITLTMDRLDGESVLAVREMPGYEGEGGGGGGGGGGRWRRPAALRGARPPLGRPARGDLPRGRSRRTGCCR